MISPLTISGTIKPAALAITIALALAGGCVIDEDIGDAPGAAGATDGGTTDGGGTTDDGGGTGGGDGGTDVGSSNVWVTKSSMPTPRIGVAAAVVGGKIYVIGGQGGVGGLNVNEEYDPDADAWRTRSDMPTARSFPAGSASGGKNYVFGGDVGAMADNTNEEYDPVTNTWTIRTVMPTKRFGAASVEVNGKIYVLGGDDFPPSNIVEEYDPSLDEWTNCSGLPNPPCAAMPIGRFDFAAVALNGKIYVLGGDTGGGNAISTVHEFDTLTNIWTNCGIGSPGNNCKAMPNARSALSAAVVNGRIYAIGGGDPIEISQTNVVEEYNPNTNTWLIKSPMPTARTYAAIGVVFDIVYVIGGGGGGTVEAYDPSIDVN